MDGIPWVEKYRPTTFDQIILNEHNRSILQSIISNDFNVNMIFYGPPGTGKTTTIIGMIKQYYGANTNSKGLVMHLNASDDRGIDLIRNQIHAFVVSDNLFTNGKKIVVLDEADYMTMMAQHALKSLIETSVDNVRFIIICNYICKIEQSLLSILVQIRFNHLPQSEIISFLKDICEKENISLPLHVILKIQKKFGYDIRSMINYMQFNNRDLLESQNIIKKARTSNAIINSSDVFLLEIRLRNDVLGLAKRNNYTCHVDAVCAMLEEWSKHIEVRSFWIELFYELFCQDYRAIHKCCDIMKRVINNNTISTVEMHRHLFYLTCKALN